MAALLLSFASSAEDDLESKVKAAYLFHLTKFVDWPDMPTDHLRICVIGNDPVGKMLGELSDRRVKELPLKIEVNTPVDLATCQILFISRSEKHWGEILNRLNGTNVLTVSDLDNFARRGGIVSFYSEDGKIKLEINPAAVRKTNLRISSKLMELARSSASPQE